MGTFKLVEVAGSLIACVRAKLSMRALESAYLNGDFVRGELLFSSREIKREAKLRMKRQKRIFRQLGRKPRRITKMDFHAVNARYAL